MNEINRELTAIRDTIGLYIEGLRTGDTSMLRKAFHPRAMMYGTGPNNVTIVEIEGLFGFVAANEAPVKTGEPHQCFITDISYTGHTAHVEMVEESSYGSDYMNYFQLLKIEGQWLIVSKAYSVMVSKK